MKKETATAIVCEMVAELLKVERYTKQDFQNRWPHHPATFADLLTQAEDVMRAEHGIEFRPGPHGSRQRATYTETFNRSKRQRRAGIKKLERSAMRMDVAAKMAPAAERDAVEKTAATQKLQVTMAKTRSRKKLSAADSGERKNT